MRLVLGAAAFLMLLAAAPALAQNNACTSVAAGQTTEITSHMVCRRVSNNGTMPVCAISNASTNEWASFYDYPPANIAVSACVNQCAGGVFNGFACYRAGSGINSCNTVCAGYGGCDDAGTRAIGSDDTLGLECTLIALQLGYLNVGLIGDINNAAGCHISGLLTLRRGTAYTTCAASAANRICACNS